MNLLIVGLLAVLGIVLFIAVYGRRLKHRKGPWIFYHGSRDPL